MITPDHYAALETATVQDILDLDPRIRAFIDEILSTLERTPTETVMFSFALLLGSIFADAALAASTELLDIDERLRVFALIVRRSYAENIDHMNTSGLYGQKH